LLLWKLARTLHKQRLVSRVLPCTLTSPVFRGAFLAVWNDAMEARSRLIAILEAQLGKRAAPPEASVPEAQEEQEELDEDGENEVPQAPQVVEATLAGAEVDENLTEEEDVVAEAAVEASGEAEAEAEVEGEVAEGVDGEVEGEAEAVEEVYEEETAKVTDGYGEVEIVEEAEEEEEEEEAQAVAEGDFYPEIIPETFAKEEEVALNIEVLNDDEDDVGEESFFSTDLAKVDQGLDDRAKLMSALKASLGRPIGGGSTSSAAVANCREDDDEEEEAEEPPAKRIRTLAEMPLLGGAPPSTAQEAQALAARKAALLRSLAGAAGAVSAATAEETSPKPVVVAKPAPVANVQTQSMTPEEYEAYRQKCWIEYYEKCDEWKFSYEQSKRARELAPRTKGKGKSKGKNEPAPPPVVSPNPGMLGTSMAGKGLQLGFPVRPGRPF